ncbi:MAG: Rpn family recombination-promoting nuclease/putative transposase [Lachnospiraceae bacterium]|nr:Rpn family recombination-promoting nuclease/putative transposase [Lachnospiraceae bacterium]
MKKNLNYNSCGREEATPKAYSFAEATGPVSYTLTNDYLFRAVFQSNQKALKGLLCALLHLNPDDIKSLVIQNPIEIGDTIEAKDFMFDIKLVLNDTTIVNIELQVANERNWPERSLSYLCRSFDNLEKGQVYKTVKTAIHIGILNFDVFSESPEFYAAYKVSNVKTHKIYSDKFILYVLNLNRSELATEEDRKYDIDCWAQLFKATDWEEIKMLAKKNSAIVEAANAMYDFTADSVIREHCLMREEFQRRQLERAMWEKELEEKIAQSEDILAKTEDKLTQTEDKLTQTEDKLTQANEEIERLQAELAELKNKTAYPY